MLPTPLELIRLTAEYLAGERGVVPRLDAEVLLAHVLGVPRIQLYVQFDTPPGSARRWTVYRELVRRRGRREPVAHLLGTREFWSLELAVDRRVLVPRPETETPGGGEPGAHGARRAASPIWAPAPAPSRWRCSSERPGWTGVGVDVSAEALDVARGQRATGTASRTG